MAIQKTKGIVLKSWDFSETSKLVSFITRDQGGIRVLAKGARRPLSGLRGSLELFNHGVLIFYPSRFSDLHLLGQFEVINSYPASRNTLEKAAFFYYLAELVASAAFGAEQSHNLYSLFLGALEYSSSIKNVSYIQIWFELQFLQSLGVFPPSGRCSHCGQKLPGAVYLSGRKGEWLCPSCRKRDPDSFVLSPGIIAAIRYLLAGGIERAERLKLYPPQNRELRLVTRSLIDTHLDKRLKSRRFLEQIINLPQA